MELSDKDFRASITKLFKPATIYYLQINEKIENHKKEINVIKEPNDNYRTEIHNNKPAGCFKI